jgi:hypothetical protein
MIVVRCSIAANSSPITRPFGLPEPMVARTDAKADDRAWRCAWSPPAPARSALLAVQPHCRPPKVRSRRGGVVNPMRMSLLASRAFLIASRHRSPMATDSRRR